MRHSINVVCLLTWTVGLSIADCERRLSNYNTGQIPLSVETFGSKFVTWSATNLSDFPSNQSASRIPVYNDEIIGIIKQNDEKEGARRDGEDFGRSDGGYVQGNLRNNMHEYTSEMQSIVGDDVQLSMKEPVLFESQYDESLQLQHDIGIAQFPYDLQLQLHGGPPNISSHAKLLRTRMFLFVFLIFFAVLHIAYQLRAASLVDKTRLPYGRVPPNPAKPGKPGNETKPAQDTKPEPAQDHSDSLPGPSNILPEASPADALAVTNKNANPFGIESLKDQVINLLGMEVTGPENAKNAVIKFLNNVVLLMHKRSEVEQGIIWSYDVFSEISELVDALACDTLVRESVAGQVRIGNFEFPFYASKYMKSSIISTIDSLRKILSMISERKRKLVSESTFNDSTTFKDILASRRLVEGEDINKILRVELYEYDYTSMHYLKDLALDMWPDGLAKILLHYNGLEPFRFMNVDPSEYSQTCRETWQLAVEIASDWRLKRGGGQSGYIMALRDILVNPSLSGGRGKRATGAETFTLWALKKLKGNLSERIGLDGWPVIIEDKAEALRWIDLEMIRLGEGMQYIEDSEKYRENEGKSVKGVIGLLHLKNALLFQMDKYKIMKQNIEHLDMESGQCVLKAAFLASGYKEDAEAVRHELTGKKAKLVALLLDIVDL